MPDDTALTILGQRRGRWRSAAGVLSSLPGVGQPGYRAVRSLYVHVPFCFHKCHYCDFYSLVDTRDRQEAFTARLIRELEALSAWSAGEALETVFVGGGTPSLLRPELWARVLEALGAAYDLSRIRAGRGEFTVECNPETVTGELMSVLAKGGVDRVSVGAQSFDARHLSTLERWHNPESVARAIELARRAGIRRQSVDLIYAIPGQTVEQWSRDLERALGLETEHISAYALTYEPGTAMTRRLERGAFEPATDEIEVEMHELAVARLREAGMERYEVSNFARPGAECAHNLAYWRQRDWLAAGPSASGHVAGHRWKNTANLREYLERDDQGFAPIEDHEPPDPRRALAERIMTGLRLREGVPASAVLAEAEALGDGAPGRLLQTVASQVERGWLKASADRWRLTDSGFLFADGIAAEMMAQLG